MSMSDVIHPVLTQSLQKLQEYFASDDRCVSMFLWGSLDTQTADEWSDVDVCAVFRDADYPTVKESMRAICEQFCGPILVWLPEGESKASVNYAFLFEVDGRVHLYDFSIFSVSALQAATWMRPRTILFDKSGTLPAVDGAPVAIHFKSEQLLHQINNWWVYTYLNGKYYKRGDTYKMLYVQQVIFATHMRVLQAFHTDMAWNWWARDVHHLPTDKQEQLLVYFPSPNPRAVAEALRREMDIFSTDAREACRLHGVDYPYLLEDGVRRHLRTFGLVT